MSSSTSSTTDSSTTSSIPLPSFEIGETVNGSWKVIREIGSGGFGIVYEVEKISGNDVGIRAALKAETVDTDRNFSQTLVAEASILRSMVWSQHFCRLYVAGRMSPNCNIIVMSLVGRPLSWLQHHNPLQRFSVSTAVRLGIQCLEAIKDLHSIGIIHRDVKGSNFAIGQGDLCRVVHMLDFGFARFYLKKGPDGELHHRKPRKKGPFLGTEQYCSVFAHKQQEQGRRDDLWSFLYMMVEFITGKLPWLSSSSKKFLILKSQSEENLLKNCPQEFYTIHDQISSLSYSDRPNYDLIIRKLYDICDRKHYMPNDPFDWEEGGRYCDEYLRAVKKAELVTQLKTEIAKKSENNEEHKEKIMTLMEQLGHKKSFKLAHSTEESSSLLSNESFNWSEIDQSNNIDHIWWQERLSTSDGSVLDNEHNISEQPSATIYPRVPPFHEELS